MASSVQRETKSSSCELSQSNQVIKRSASLEETAKITSPCDNETACVSETNSESMARSVCDEDVFDEQQSERRIIELPLVSAVSLPDPDEDVSPDEFLLKLVAAQYGFSFEAKPALSLDGFFVEVSEKQMAAYNNDVVSAVRNNELDHLKQLHADGQLMNCFNRFGESLLNIACRRGFQSIVRYLFDQPDISIRHRDDCGRTPLHDACWHPSPQLTICKWILETDPVLYFIKDRRGCTAFQFARPEHWPIWRQFLLDNRESLDGLTDPEIQSRLTTKA